VTRRRRGDQFAAGFDRNRNEILLARNPTANDDPERTLFERIFDGWYASTIPFFRRLWERWIMTNEVDPEPLAAGLDLRAYLARIGYAGDLAPTLGTLRGLHLAHATTIPFENLDILLGRSIELEIAKVQAKLVAGRRGGYCFEQNTLFAAVLEAIGFDVTRLGARVLMGIEHIRPRTHMLLAVAADGTRWLADVGFGGEGLLVPVLLDQQNAVEQFGRIFRVDDRGPIKVLQALHSDGWFNLYAFSLEQQYPIDYVVANHYTSTHPDSVFVKSLVVQRMGVKSRWVLRNRELTEINGDGTTKRQLPDDDTLLRVLADVFELPFPAGTRFSYEQGS
jgi:N-hydroxyarylamine O-acetyltransferase